MKKRKIINQNCLRNDIEDRIHSLGIKTIVITEFHTFKKLEERLNVLSRHDDVNLKK